MTLSVTCPELAKESFRIYNGWPMNYRLRWLRRLSDTISRTWSSTSPQSNYLQHLVIHTREAAA
ncbi:hypothetical protein SAMN05444166_5046 [Singulisphaera sp. GP187]|nr:hypothetical protein SAMN05444166_5046 [Singulisphaera sp. GP187]